SATLVAARSSGSTCSLLTTFEKRSDPQKREKPYAQLNRERRKQQPDRRRVTVGCVCSTGACLRVHGRCTREHSDAKRANGSGGPLRDLQRYAGRGTAADSAAPICAPGDYRRRSGSRTPDRRRPFSCGPRCRDWPPLTTVSEAIEEAERWTSKPKNPIS